MKKIKRNSKAFFVIFGIIDGLLVLAALLLLFFSILYKGNLAPQLFSRRVYIIETDAFSLVKKGSAVIAEQVGFDSIVPGNIILYNEVTNNGSGGLDSRSVVGEVQKSIFENGIYTYIVKNDAGSALTVGQSHILGKGIYYSEILGVVISFATSPAGVCCVAVLPCAAFFIWEIVNAMKRKSPQSTVSTVKKQDETPTYVPPKSTKKSEGKEQTTDIPFEERPAFADERQKLVEAAGLFAPSKKPEPQPAKRQPAPSPYVPVRESDIDKLIQQAKAKRQGANEPTPKPIPASSSTSPQRQRAAATAARSAYQQVQRDTALPDDTDRESAAVRSPNASDTAYHRDTQGAAGIPSGVETPAPRRTSETRSPTDYSPAQGGQRRAAARKSPSAARSSPRVSRLDSLLNDESSGDSEYDINNILKNLN